LAPESPSGVMRSRSASCCPARILVPAAPPVEPAARRHASATPVPCHGCSGQAGEESGWFASRRTSRTPHPPLGRPRRLLGHKGRAARRVLEERRGRQPQTRVRCARDTNLDAEIESPPRAKKKGEERTFFLHHPPASSPSTLPRPPPAPRSRSVAGPTTLPRSPTRTRQRERYTFPSRSEAAAPVTTPTAPCSRQPDPTRAPAAARRCFRTRHRNEP